MFFNRLQNTTAVPTKVHSFLSTLFETVEYNIISGAPSRECIFSFIVETSNRHPLGFSTVRLLPPTNPLTVHPVSRRPVNKQTRLLPSPPPIKREYRIGLLLGRDVKSAGVFCGQLFGSLCDGHANCILN